jgi:murein DD-endopeptidase MepM/ murein hydrolase activator NlpD
MPVFVRSRGADSAPSEITFQLSVDRLLHVRRTSDSTWESTEERLPWRNDTLVVGGRIDANLYQALDDSAASLLPKGARAELAWAIADIYEYRVDMSRDLRPGDSFRVLFERAVGPGGVVKIGDVLAVHFDLSGSPVEAIRFATGARRAEYFDQTGRSLRAAFLRAPLAFRRISSVFGLRKHPILGVWRQHKGTDYAANAGTPVRAIGDGAVIFAGRKRGYGNVLELRHRNGFVSRYGHLRAFAAGIRRGKSVAIGQTVAYVGMTGLATAPHLHFEILVNGLQRNPSMALNRKDGFPIAAGERARFMTLRSTLLAALDQRGGEQLAGR